MSDEEPPKEPAFNQDQLAEFDEAFGIFDKDGDGRITTQEMSALLGACGFSPSPEDVADYCARIDQTGENLFNKEEFLQVAEHFNNTSNLEEVVTACLRVFFGTDKKLTMEHLKNILTTLGNPLTPEEIKHLTFNIDPDGDNLIPIADVVAKICGSAE